MSAKRKPNPNVLDVTRFADSPSYELAVVVHRETEAQRAIEAQAFIAQHGDIPPATNALQALLNKPPDGSVYKPWGEYAMSFDVLRRCSEALGITEGKVAKRIALEFLPDNAEPMFWMAEWLLVLDEALDLEERMEELSGEIKQAKEKRRQAAIAAAKEKHEDHSKAKDYVLSGWQLYSASYKGNRTSGPYRPIGLRESELRSAAQTVLSAAQTVTTIRAIVSIVPHRIQD